MTDALWGDRRFRTLNVVDDQFEAAGVQRFARVAKALSQLAHGLIDAPQLFD